MADLAINRGTTYSRTIEYSVDGVPTTLVGATVRFTMKSSEFDDDPTDAAAEIVKNVTSGNAQGIAVITINPSDTATVEPGDYFYDIKVDVHSNGVTIYKIDEGTITLDGSPTNRLS